MRVLLRCFFTAVLAVVYCFLFAQTGPSAIQGKVLAENNAIAEAATVVLLTNADSLVVSSTLVSKTGSFQFENIKPGTYLILVTEIGYGKTYAGPYRLASAQSINTGNIILKPSTNQLQGVTITSHKPAIEVRAGKTILNVQNDIISTGNSAYDILRKSAGVHVNSNETLSITGRQPALVTIDGKATNFTGDDLVNLLRGIQSNTIDQIEIITSPSAKYDAAGGGGVINIILKKGKNYGANGSVNAMAGYGKYYKSTVGIVFNNRTTRLNIFGDYTFDDSKSARSITTSRKVTDTANGAANVSNYNVDYNNIQRLQNNNFKAGADYNLPHKQTVGFLVNGIIRTEEFIKNNNLQITDQNQPASMINARSNLDRGSTYLNYNASYNAILDKSGKSIALDVSYATYKRYSNEYITNYFLSPQSVLDSTSRLENLSPSNIHMWTAKLDYVAPISKVSRFEAGVKYNRTQSNNDLVFGPVADSLHNQDDQLVNRFIYTEAVSAGYVNYANKIGRFDFSAGLRAEYTSSEGVSSVIDQLPNKNHYFNLFPQVQVSYLYDKKNVFGISFNRGITRPAYEDVNPFLYYTDIYDYREGNPALKPEYINWLQVTHTYNQTFSTSIYYKVTNDAFDFPVYEQNDTTKVNVTIRKNFGQMFVYGATFYTPAQFTSWWNATFYLDANYVRYKAYVQNGPFDKGKQDITFISTQNFNITKTLSAEVEGKYETPTIYGVNELKANYEVDAGISKLIFNKLGSIRLNIIDVFNTDRTRNHAVYRNVDLTEVNKRDSRIIQLNFSYRFGKGTPKSAKKRETDNEDEKNRMMITN